MDLEALKNLLQDLDPAALLPELDGLLEKTEGIVRLAVMLGPVILLILGLLYFFAAPKEANHYFGYRCYFGMGSIRAWRFTQKFSGMVLGGLGLILTVIMAIAAGRFRTMDVQAMLYSGIKCLIWEAALTLIAIVGINVTVAILFDRNGNFRKGNQKN